LRIPHTLSTRAGLLYFELVNRKEYAGYTSSIQSVKEQREWYVDTVFVGLHGDCDCTGRRLGMNKLLTFGVKLCWAGADKGKIIGWVQEGIGKNV